MDQSPFVTSAIATILRELVHGTATDAGWVLNPDDAGLLDSLGRVSADEASRVPPEGTSSVAAHVDHLRYGLSLLNRASAGENPFADADWGAAWKSIQVTDDQWVRLRGALADETRAWQGNFPRLVDAGELELTGVLASAAHLAYHLGAIRQMLPATRGPVQGS